MERIETLADAMKEIERLTAERDAPRGTYACPYCGKDTPHYHSPEDLEVLRLTASQRPRFEAWLSTEGDRDADGHFTNGQYPVWRELAYLFEMITGRVPEWRAPLMGALDRGTPAGLSAGMTDYKHPMTEFAWRCWKLGAVDVTSRLASLSADYAALGKVVREWQEARKALNASQGIGDPDRLFAAEVALAAHPLEAK